MKNEADQKQWLESVRRDIDKAKVSVTSNQRLDETTLARFASELESVYKGCRTLLEAEQQT